MVNVNVAFGNFPVHRSEIEPANTTYGPMPLNTSRAGFVIAFICVYSDPANGTFDESHGHGYFFGKCKTRSRYSGEPRPLLFNSLRNSQPARLRKSKFGWLREVQALECLNLIRKAIARWRCFGKIRFGRLFGA